MSKNDAGTVACATNWIVRQTGATGYKLVNISVDRSVSGSGYTRIVLRHTRENGKAVFVEIDAAARAQLIAELEMVGH